MKQYIAAIAALAIALTPAFGTAMERGPRGGGGGGARGGGGGRASTSRPAPSRPSGGQARPASRPAAQPGRQSGGGFNLKGDTKPTQRPANSAGAGRPSGGTINRGNGNGGNKVGNGNGNNNRGNGNGNNNRGNGNTVNNGGNRTNVNTGNRNNVNVSGNTVNRTVVSNPVYGNSGAWGWNHGSAWYPAPNYWGGGFWGAMAVGATSAAIYGSIVNSANHTTYTSYQVQPSSPGATVLSNYQLQQTQCGGSGQVVIYGPSNSVICANPNSLVSAGEYNLDTSSLSLTAV
jgi:hypothetical protein